MMRRPERFWRALETVPGLSAVEAEWRATLGGDYAWARRWLAPTSRLARCVPGGNGEPWDVIEHAPNRSVAIDPRGGPAVAVSRSQRVVHRFDVAAFLPDLARSLGVANATPRTLTVWSWCLGGLECDGTRVGVAFVVAPSEAPLADPALVGVLSGRYVAAFTSLARLSGADQEMFARRRIAPLDLSSAMLVDGAGKLHLTDSIEVWARQTQWDSGEAVDDELNATIAKLQPRARSALRELAARGCTRATAPNKPTLDVLARWLGRECNSNFKGMMSRLGAAGLVRNAARDGGKGGYYLTAKGNAAADLIRLS
jgi:hypothetical protein